MKLTPKDLGFHFNVPHNVIVKTVLITVLFCLFLLVFKAVLVDTVKFLQGLPLLAPKGMHDHSGNEMSSLQMLIFALSYVLFCPLQVFLIHCAMQGILQDVLPSRAGRIFALVFGVVAMCVVHIPAGPVFALSVIIPAILWGYLYMKYRNAYLVTASHILIGLWALFVLDYVEVFFLIHYLGLK